MKLRKLAVYWALVAAVSAPALLSADEPSSRPASTAAPNAMMPRRATRNFNNMGRTASRPYSQQEWDLMMAFLDENSPEIAHVLRTTPNLPPDAPLRMELIRKWRNYNIVRENFPPEMAAAYVQQFKVEDDLFGLAVKVRLDPTNSLYRDKISKDVADLVQIGFKQREIRIEQLQKMLDTEKHQLDQVKKNKDQIIQKRTTDRLNRIYGNSSASTQPSASDALDDVILPDHIVPN